MMSLKRSPTGEMKAKLTQDEKATSHQVRSREELQKKNMIRAKAILKRHPYAADVAVNALVASGFTEQSPIMELPKSMQTASYEKREQVKKEKANLSAQDLATQYGVHEDEIVPLKYTVIGDLTLTLICDKLLAVIEKTTCSKSNMRSMLSRLARMSSAPAGKPMVLQMFEKATGLTSDYPISGDLRVWQTLQELANRLNVLRNRPIADICMSPAPNFIGDDGAYATVVKGNALYVYVKMIGSVSELKVDPSTLPAGTDPDVVQLTANFSFERCSLWVPGATEWNASAPKLSPMFCEAKCKAELGKAGNGAQYFAILNTVDAQSLAADGVAPTVPAASRRSSITSECANQGADHELCPANPRFMIQRGLGKRPRTGETTALAAPAKHGVVAMRTEEVPEDVAGEIDGGAVSSLPALEVPEHFDESLIDIGDLPDEESQ